MSTDLQNPANEPDKMLALVQSASLTRLLAEAVEKMILSGEIKPGGKLNEMAIAERFGVSRGPLREAFRMLEESGLVRQEKNRGAFVREVDIGEAAEIYEVRAGLDATAGRLLAGKITPAQIEQLRQCGDDMQRAAQDNDVDAFHQIVAMTENACLIDVYRRLVKQLVLFRRRNLLAPRAIPNFADEHSAIVDSLARGDGALAAELLYRHAEGGRQRMLQIHAEDQAGHEAAA
ncbi:MAG: FCD domain-containing protein [Dechloromonas sp.]|nr:FCD domain-containing protein [Dechloromonas sp.]